jgi:ComF family protein
MSNGVLDLFFPKFCLGCKGEGSYLCQDCKGTLDILRIHQRHKTRYLSDLYFALPYQGGLIKKLILSYKYEPFLKNLSLTLSSLILDHFELLDKRPNFADFCLIPIPLEKRKLRWRGFNQSGEIARELSKSLKIPFLENILMKIKTTLPQVELSEKERRENVRGSFFVKNKDSIKGKKILLVDDIYTTGSTMEEAARILRESGAKEVIGIVIARAKAGEDKLEA